MYTQSSKLILASSIALAMGVISGTVAADTASQDVTDARQQTQIWTTYALNPYLHSNDLKVSVHNGKATLTGEVEENANKDLAKQIALDVSGVREVDNQIMVQADYTPPLSSSVRSYGEVIDDATITAEVKSKLMWNKYTVGQTTDVDTMRGKVTLQGTADSTADKDHASRLAMNTRGVVSVDNQLVVYGAKPTMSETVKRDAHDVGRDIADSWITTKVKSTFLYSRNVDSADISVSTNSGIVTLRGNVDSRAQRALAIGLANDVRGVKSVNSQNLTI